MIVAGTCVRNATRTRTWKNFMSIKGLNHDYSKTLHQNQIRQFSGPGLVRICNMKGFSGNNLVRKPHYQRFLFSTESKVSQASDNPVPKSEQTSNEKIFVKETLTRAEKLKKAVKEYGSTVIVFHVGISLISLGTCYLLVSAGLDTAAVFNALGLQDWATKSQIAASAGTFAVAYAVHKVFAPVRITITLGSVPFIVRYLRKIGFLKK